MISNYNLLYDNYICTQNHCVFMHQNTRLKAFFSAYVRLIDYKTVVSMLLVEMVFDFKRMFQIIKNDYQSFAAFCRIDKPLLMNVMLICFQE